MRRTAILAVFLAACCLIPAARAGDTDDSRSGWSRDRDTAVSPPARRSTGGTSREVGGTVYHDFSDGTRGTSREIGGTTYHRFSDGTRGTSREVGGTTYHSHSDGTRGTSKDIGGTTYHRFSDSTRGTSREVGGTTYHRFSDSTRGTSREVGGTTYHRFSGSTPERSTRTGGVHERTRRDTESEARGTESWRDNRRPRIGNAGRDTQRPAPRTYTRTRPAPNYRYIAPPAPRRPVSTGGIRRPAPGSGTPGMDGNIRITPVTPVGIQPLQVH